MTQGTSKALLCAPLPHADAAVVSGHVQAVAVHPPLQPQPYIPQAQVGHLPPLSRRQQLTLFRTQHGTSKRDCDSQGKGILVPCVPSPPLLSLGLPLKRVILSWSCHMLSAALPPGGQSRASPPPRPPSSRPPSQSRPLPTWPSPTPPSAEPGGS
jgi:hypothetical protein